MNASRCFSRQFRRLATSTIRRIGNAPSPSLARIKSLCSTTDYNCHLAFVASSFAFVPLTVPAFSAASTRRGRLPETAPLPTSFVRQTPSCARMSETVFARSHFSRGLAPEHFQVWACKGSATPRCERNNRSASMVAWINGSRATERSLVLLTSTLVTKGLLIFSLSLLLTPLGSAAPVATRIARVGFREGWKAFLKLRRGVGQNYERLTPTQIAIGWCRLLDYNRSM